MLWQYSDGDTPNWNIKYRGMKKLRLLTSVSLYLRNNTRYGHSCCGLRIGNRTWACEWHHFSDLEWPLTHISRSNTITWHWLSDCLRNGTTAQLLVLLNLLLLCGPLRVAISWNGADVCLSVCLSVTCHISKTEPDRAIVTMDHYIEVGCN